MAKQKHPKTMEEVINSIRRVCDLAKNLESDLPNLANQPAVLSLSIDEIVQTLSAAKERLLIPPQEQIPSSSFTQMLLHETQQPRMDASAALMQEWLRSSYAMTMNQLFQMQPLQAEGSTAPYEARSLVESKTMGRVDFSQLRARDTLQIGEMGGTNVVDSERLSKGSQGEVQAMEASPSRPRRSDRNIDLEKRKIIVPAPQFGNREMPPEDGFAWRKYGQKDILNSKYPRSYYRCTHQKLYDCGAKKLVQRHDRNPSMFEVTYRGNHTCHMSPTAPSSVPPQQLLSREMTQSAVPSQLSPSSASVSGRWLSSMNLSLGAGASGSRYGADYPVADMADAMFNSAAGSSSGNSMESLFPPAEDKWEPKEAKRRKD